MDNDVWVRIYHLRSYIYRRCLLLILLCNVKDMMESTNCYSLDDENDCRETGVYVLRPPNRYSRFDCVTVCIKTGKPFIKGTMPYVISCMTAKGIDIKNRIL